MSSHKDKWRIETTGVWGIFRCANLDGSVISTADYADLRIYNQERYGGRRLLALNDNGDFVLKKRDGGANELWDVRPF